MLPGFSEQVLRYKPSKNSRNQYRSFTEFDTPATDNTQNRHHHRSPGLLNIIREARNTPQTLLDLGARSQENMEIWRRLFNEVYFEDLGSSLQWHKQAKHSDQFEPISPTILRYPDNQKFDVIIAWDIFNFCSSEQLTCIADRLKSISHDNTVILTSLYTGKNIPKRPARFWLDNDEKLQIENLAQDDRKQDRLTVTGLMKFLQEQKWWEHLPMKKA